MVFYMHKIKLTGIISVSSDLFNRLVARGLLDSSHNCTADFLQYIQECIARDDIRCNISTQSSEQQLVEDETVNIENQVTPASEDKQQSIESVYSSLVDGTDLAELRKSMNTLYQGG